jgi:hypothetical protein
MAVVKGPLMSLGASGTYGGTLVFSRYPKSSTVRRKRVARAPYDPATETQLFNRYFFKNCVAIWQQLETEVKQELDTLGQAVAYSGFNFFIKEYRDRRPTECGNAHCGFSQLGDLTL